VSQINHRTLLLRDRDRTGNGLATTMSFGSAFFVVLSVWDMPDAALGMPLPHLVQIWPTLQSEVVLPLEDAFPDDAVRTLLNLFAPEDGYVS
jgi:hypothetical protein